MKSDTETIIKTLRVLALQFGDGVANAAIAEAADRLQEQQERIKRLTEAGDALAENTNQFAFSDWHKAKESKP